MSGTNGTAHLSARGVIALEGDERRQFLQGIVTNDLNALGPTTPLYAALLTPQGKYLHDFIIVEDGARLLLDCEAARRADLLRRLMMYRLRARVEISDLTETHAVIAWWGERVPPELPEDAVACDDPRHPRLGRRAIVPRDRIPAALGSDAEWDDHRLTLGIPDASRDFEVERTLILEGNLDALNGVSFSKGCYVGQELTARMKHRGRVRKRLLPVAVEGPLPAPDTPILKDGREIGHIRSGRGRRAIAYLRVEDMELGAHYPCGDAHVIPERPEWLPPEWLDVGGKEEA